MRTYGIRIPKNRKNKTLFTLNFNHLFLVLEYGNYSDWGEWSACSRTCGNNGYITRIRACDKPLPLIKDQPKKNCYNIGPAKELQKCKVAECPGNGAYVIHSIYIFIYLMSESLYNMFIVAECNL